MTDIASHHIAIWIDPKEAILLALEFSPDGSSALPRPGNGRSLHRVRAQQHFHRQQYYEAVLSWLEPEDEVLILGPGQAKRELRHQIEQWGGLKGKVAGLYEASTLASVELAFPTSHLQRLDMADGISVQDHLLPQAFPDD